MLSTSDGTEEEDTFMRAELLDAIPSLTVAEGVWTDRSHRYSFRTYALALADAVEYLPTFAPYTLCATT